MLQLECVPHDLFSLQKWFASIITRPMDREGRILPVAPSGRPLSEEAAEFILPSRTLPPDRRIEIYNQQYWWRLLTILHENFPALRRLFGSWSFNQTIGIPFLVEYPSQHWSLVRLGDRLVCWLKEHYAAGDRLLVQSIAELDWAYQEAFFAQAPLPLTVGSEHLSMKMDLQKHVKLFKLPFDLFSFRSDLLKQTVEFWEESEFPPLPKGKDYFFLLYRNEHNRVCYREIEEGEWTLLHLIETGLTLEEACDRLERAGGSAYCQAEACLVGWIQGWIAERLLNVIQR